LDIGTTNAARPVSTRSLAVEISVLIGTQILWAIPILAVAATLGDNHWKRAILGGATVWPWVLASYLPMLFFIGKRDLLVPIFGAIGIRMLGTLFAILAMRQIAAPLATREWFGYIFAFYLGGLLVESWLMVRHLQRPSQPAP
jgi:hypothetical protein